MCLRQGERSSTFYKIKIVSSGAELARYIVYSIIICVYLVRNIGVHCDVVKYGEPIA